MAVRATVRAVKNSRKFIPRKAAVVMVSMLQLASRYIPCLFLTDPSSCD